MRAISGTRIAAATVWSSLLATPTARAAHSAAQLHSFGRQLFAPVADGNSGSNSGLTRVDEADHRNDSSSNRVAAGVRGNSLSPSAPADGTARFVCPPSSDRYSATPRFASPALHMRRSRLVTGTTQVAPLSVSLLRSVQSAGVRIPFSARRPSPAYARVPVSTTQCPSQHTTNTPISLESSAHLDAPSHYASHPSSRLVTMLQFVTNGPASRPYFVLLYACLALYLGLLLSNHIPRLVPQNPAYHAVAIIVLALTATVFAASVCVRMCHLRRRRVIGSCTYTLRGLLSDSDAAALDNDDGDDEHVLRPGERFCQPEVEATAFEQSLLLEDGTPAANSETIVPSTASASTGSSPEYTLLAPLAPRCLRRCLRRVGRLGSHVFNVLCPQLEFAASLLRDGYLTVEQLVMDALRTRTPALATVALLAAVAGGIVFGSFVFFLQCQRELAHVATLTQTFWREQVTTNSDLHLWLNSTSAQLQRSSMGGLFSQARSAFFSTNGTRSAKGSWNSNSSYSQSDANFTFGAVNASTDDANPAAWLLSIREWTDAQLQSRFGSTVSLEMLESHWALLFDDADDEDGMGANATGFNVQSEQILNVNATGNASSIATDNESVVTSTGSDPMAVAAESSCKTKSLSSGTDSGDCRDTQLSQHAESLSIIVTPPTLSPAWSRFSLSRLAARIMTAFDSADVPTNASSVASAVGGTNATSDKSASPLSSAVASLRAMFSGIPLNQSHSSASPAGANGTAAASGYLSGGVDLPFSLASVGEYVRGPGLALLSLLFIQLPLATASALVGASKWLADTIFSFVVFLSALSLILASEQEPLDFLRTLVPGGESRRRIEGAAGVQSDSAAKQQALPSNLDVATSLSSAVSDVFVSSWKTAHFHFLLTWLAHAATGSPVQTLPACLSAMMALLPLLPPFLVAVPLAAHLWFWQDRAFAAAAVLGSHVAAYMVVVPAVYSEVCLCAREVTSLTRTRRSLRHFVASLTFLSIPLFHVSPQILLVDPYITALSIVGGLTAFGLEGALIGPLMVCVLVVGRDVLTAALTAPSDR